MITRFCSARRSSRLNQGEGRLTPATLRELRPGHDEQIAPVWEGRAETALLEHRLSDLVNAAYGFTPEEVTLL